MLFTRECIYTNDSQETCRNFAKDPAVARLGDTYFLYFSTLDETDPEKFRIGIATSQDLENWKFQTLIPLEGDCEKNGVAAPGAWTKDGVIHLFYQTYGNGKKDAICHAYSEDGIHFTRNTTNPIFSPDTDWCCGRAIDADLVEFQNRLYLYFVTRDHSFVTQMIGVAYTVLPSDFTKDTWTQAKAEACICPALPWEKSCAEAPAAIKQNGKIYLFYGGAYNCEPQQIGVAVSENAIDFTRVKNTPFYPNGPEGSWNSCESGHPYVFRDKDSHIHLFYQGSPDMGQSWYLSRMEIQITEDGPSLLF